MKHSEAFERLVAEVRPRVKEISIDDVLAKQKRGDAFAFIDVREDHEWDQGRAPGAFHIGRGILERDIEKHFPDYDQQIVLYCGGGYRSALAADNLQRMGYRNVLSMQGGFRGWREKGLPVTTE
jgi:rhodanese-related sulfurtransferase